MKVVRILVAALTISVALNVWLGFQSGKNDRFQLLPVAADKGLVILDREANSIDVYFGDVEPGGVLPQSVRYHHRHFDLDSPLAIRRARYTHSADGVPVITFQQYNGLDGRWLQVTVGEGLDVHTVHAVDDPAEALRFSGGRAL